MWPVIRRTSVPPTEMSKDHRPPSSPTGGAARPACRRWERQNLGGPPRRAQLHSLDPRRFSPSGVPRRWHRRCLTDRHRQRCSDERRIPPPSARHVAHCTPGRSPSGAGRVQRRHPQMGRGRSRGTAPPRTSLLPSFHSILPPLVCPSDPAGQDYEHVQMRYRLSRPCNSARAPQRIPPQSIVHLDERPHDWRRMGTQSGDPDAARLCPRMGVAPRPALA